MGHIDDALRLSKVDVGEGLSAPEQPAEFEFREEVLRLPARVATPCRRARPSSCETELVPGALRQPGELADLDLADGWGLVVSRSAPPLLVEQFRSLAATLVKEQAAHGIKSVIVTSASPGDGKSYVALNLSLTLSESYRRRVLLIDADLRRPTLHQTFRVRNATGLNEALAAINDELSLARLTDTLALLPAGQPEPNPLGGLSSPRMKQLVDDASARFDWVVVDTPPVGVLADARLVAESVDAALLVVRAGATRVADLQAAAETLGPDRILGIVFNAVRPLDIRSQGYYGYYCRKR